MKKIANTLLIFLVVLSSVTGQVPQKFSYQASLRNTDGTVIANEEVDMRISLRKTALDGEVVYTETHIATSNAQGVVTLTIGDGTPTLGIFTETPWNQNIFIQIEVKLSDQSDFTILGVSQILSVPYALVSGNGVLGEGAQGQTVSHNGTGWNPSSQIMVSTNTVDVISQEGRDPEEPIFTIRNSDGDVVFAVYESGVRFNVSNETTSKGSKGGFAVGGLSPTKQEVDYFTVNPDSVRFNIVENTVGKSSKGGFAVGGLSPVKNAPTNEYFSILPTDVRFTVRDDDGKSSKGGFAVGGLSPTKEIIDYFTLQSDSIRFNLVEDKTGKASKGGFAVGGLSPTKESGDYLTINSDSTFIYTNLTTTGNVNVSGNLYTGGTISSPPVTYNGYTYQTVKIGNQVWMVENLRTTQYQDGSAINTFNDVFDYNFDPLNRDSYGLLYSHTAIQSASGLCPEYWHIPNQGDFEELFAYLGGEWWSENPDIIAERLLEVDFWDLAPGTLSPNNLSGFSARPAGYGTLPVAAGNPEFFELREKTYFWTSGDGFGDPLSGAYIFSRISGESIIAIPVTDLTSKELYSVRCLKWNY